VSSKAPFVARLLETALRTHANAWAMQDQDAAGRADRDVARLSAWLERLEPPQLAPLEMPGYRDWHSMVEHMPWLRRVFR
jgi:hypothetical protein